MRRGEKFGALEPVRVEISQVSRIKESAEQQHVDSGACVSFV